jgi:hypothetical protein
MMSSILEASTQCDWVHSKPGSALEIRYDGLVFWVRMNHLPSTRLSFQKSRFYVLGCGFRVEKVGL